MQKLITTKNNRVGKGPTSTLQTMEVNLLLLISFFWGGGAYTLNGVMQVKVIGADTISNITYWS